MKPSNDIFTAYDESKSSTEKQQSLSKLKDYYDAQDNSALMHAAYLNRLDVLQDLILLQVPNLKLTQQKDRLMLARVDKEAKKIIKEELYDVGGYIDHKNKDGMTAIDVAVRHGHINIVKHLLLFNASVLPTEESTGSLYTALLAGHTEISELLIKASIKIEYGHLCINEIIEASFLSYDNVNVIHALPVVEKMLNTYPKLFQQWCDELSNLLQSDMNLYHVDDIISLLTFDAKMSTTQCLRRAMTIYERQVEIWKHINSVIAKNSHADNSAYGSPLSDLKNRLAAHQFMLNDAYSNIFTAINIQNKSFNDDKDIKKELISFLEKHQELREFITVLSDDTELNHDTNNNSNNNDWYTMALQAEYKSLSDTTMYQGISQLFFNHPDAGNTEETSTELNNLTLEHNGPS